MYIPDWILLPGQHYVFELSASSEALGLQGSARTRVQVRSNHMVAIIQGANRSIAASEPLSLDASATFDPDAYTQANEQSGEHRTVRSS